MERGRKEEEFEQIIFEQYFTENLESQTKNINLLMDVLQACNYEESDDKFVQLMWHHLSMFNVENISENFERDKSRQSM